MSDKIIKHEIAYDGLTPIVIYRALGGLGCCMLESAFEKGEGKISLIGIAPLATLKAFGRQIEIEIQGTKSSFAGDPYTALKQFAKGKKAIGFIGYNAVRLKENLPDSRPSTSFPDLFFHIYQTIITFYHDKQRIICLHEGTQESLDEMLEKCQIPAGRPAFKQPKKLDIKPDLTNSEYALMVERSKEFIKAGDIFQVVLSRTFHASIKASPFDVYRALRHTSPSPYHFFFEEKDFAIAGASPELMLSVQKGVIESSPIAGTSPVGEEGAQLLDSMKECAEHVMLVDLARNDVGAVSVAGTVRVADYKTIKTFSHVNHIISRVIGTLNPELHALDAFKASFPAGTLSGAPKIRAMEIIDALENKRRDLYGGAIVSLDEKGDLMSCIAIRTAFIRGSNVEVRVGAGIVLDSDALKEAEETEHKARGVFEALELAEGSMP